MAIETHCPNGHRVRVQDQLAGRTGRCPTCAATFRVEAVAELPLARLVQLDPGVVATLPRARPLTSSVQPNQGGGQPASQSLQRSVMQPPQPVVAEDPPADVAAEPRAAAAPLHPVIAERPDLTWCIAFPGGEPTEPIDAATMQAWLDGGHAAGTEVVWRADWPEWRPVQDVFPGLFGGDFRF